MNMLFSPLTIKDVTFKNRIVMSPMCMNSSDEKDGKVTEWHKIHYASRAIGGVSLIILESTAVNPQGRIFKRDLGIWNDEHIEGLSSLVQSVKQNGAKIGIQISHAGRKANIDGAVIGPSSLPYKDGDKVPEKMTLELIKQTIFEFKEAARRAKEAGFDVIELHGAHGYLINQFLSPISNQRNDQYGGTRERRYSFLREIIDEVKGVWNGPLFVRISANEYHPEGNSIDDILYYCGEMKKQGVDLIDCSSGAVTPAKIDVFPGYQVKLADTIKQNVNIKTSAVGLITQTVQAEEILKNERADLIFIGRELLRNPYWPLKAAADLGHIIEQPRQYDRAWLEILPSEELSISNRWVPGK